jgi:hypothetical protein
VAAVNHTFTHKQYTKYRERGIWEMRAVPRLGELYPGICLTTEEKVRKTSVRVAQYKNNEQAQYKNNGLTTHRRKTVTQHRTIKNTEYTTEKIVHYR